MKRKDEHIEYYLKTEYQGDTLFGDVYIEPEAITQVDYQDVDTSVDFLDHRLDFPLLINAMTGGSDKTGDINEDLARLAKEFNLAMATGSQKIIFEEEKSKDSFRIVRKTAKNNCLLGNLSARDSWQEFQAARDLIGADAMQVHLNTLQEMIMPEGDREFSMTEANLRTLREKLDFPLLVKEIGFGLSKKDLAKLYDLGYRYVDLAGHGGSNFAEIENQRRLGEDFSEFYDWGIPTAKALLDAQDRPKDLFVIASGGVQTALDLVKALVLGADMVAISGEILKYLLFGSYDAAHRYIESLIQKTKILMLALNVKNLQELKNVNYRLTGRLKDLAEKEL